VKNRVDYYLLHTYICANMGAYQHEIARSQRILKALGRLWRPLKKSHSRQKSFNLKFQNPILTGFWNFCFP